MSYTVVNMPDILDRKDTNIKVITYKRACISDCVAGRLLEYLLKQKVDILDFLLNANHGVF